MECFVKKDGKYLILQRGPHKRILPNVCMAPGGHIEFTEGLFEATRREILEETGLTINNIKVKAVGMAFLKDLDEEFYLHLVTADYASGELIDSDNDGKFMWLSPDEISKLPTLLSELKGVLPYLFDNTQNIVSYKAFYEQGNEMTNFIIEK